jgi:hypothetical protein
VLATFPKKKNNSENKKVKLKSDWLSHDLNGFVPINLMFKLVMHSELPRQVIQLFQVKLTAFAVYMSP